MLEIQPQRAGHGCQVGRYQLLVENVVSCRYRGMRGENRARRDQLHGAVKIQSLAHANSTALKQLERRVALVDMPHRGLQAQGAQRADPADSQYHFLLQAHFPVAAV